VRGGRKGRETIMLRVAAQTAPDDTENSVPRDRGLRRLRLKFFYISAPVRRLAAARTSRPLHPLNPLSNPMPNATRQPVFNPVSPV
jgi:hypothetical protein